MINLKTAHSVESRLVGPVPSVCLAGLALACSIPAQGSVEVGFVTMARHLTGMNDRDLVFEFKAHFDAGGQGRAEVQVRALDAVTPTQDGSMWAGVWTIHPGADEMSFANAATGNWILAMTSQTGGGRCIALWYGSSVASLLRDPPTGTAQSHIRLLGMRFGNGVTGEPQPTPVCDDLYSPQVFTWGEGLYLVGVGMGNIRTADKRDRSLVWLAECPPSPDPGPEINLIREPRHAEFISDGEDPRVVVQSERVLVCFRVTSSAIPLGDPAPIVFWSSTNVVNWQPDPQVALPGLAGPNFDILRNDAGLWLASTGGESGTEVRLTHLASGSAHWVTVPGAATSAVQASSRTDRLWLLPGNSATSVPHVVYLSEDGTLRRADFVQ